jgi:predicted nucleotidyltransferase
MGSLDHATLTVAERAVLERFVETLRARLGDDLSAVWLFGSRARGERIGDLSDIDVLVIAEDASWDGSARVYQALHDAARAVSLPNVACVFSVHVPAPHWISERRAVESFFVAEIDRDHIDLTPAA